MRSPLLSLIMIGAAATLQAQTQAADIKWGPPPPFLPKGAQYAVLQGDPSKEGLYTVRLQMPAGYFVPPHFHPVDEQITVVSGAFRIGRGDVEDSTRTITLTTGGYNTAPANMHHFVRAMEPSVVQVHAMGPFAITYVNKKDDPRGVQP